MVARNASWIKALVNARKIMHQINVLKLSFRNELSMCRSKTLKLGTSNFSKFLLPQSHNTCAMQIVPSILLSLRTIKHSDRRKVIIFVSIILDCLDWSFWALKFCFQKYRDTNTSTCLLSSDWIEPHSFSVKPSVWWDTCGISRAMCGNYPSVGGFDIFTAVHGDRCCICSRSAWNCFDYSVSFGDRFPARGWVPQFYSCSTSSLHFSPNWTSLY